MIYFNNIDNTFAINDSLIHKGVVLKNRQIFAVKFFVQQGKIILDPEKFYSSDY